jgi:putative exosortase-associated protein (TIGR04073 family)
MRLAAGIAALLLVAGAPLPAAADAGVPAALTKLTRGVTNVALGLPGEILSGVVREAHSDEGLSSMGSYAAHFIAGLVMGLGWGAARVGSGVVDIVTFPIPFNDNRPLLEPDYVL